MKKPDKDQMHRMACRAYRRWCQKTRSIYDEPSYDLSGWQHSIYTLHNASGRLASYRWASLRNALVRLKLS